ncbi:unnamed protein product [Rotaria sp. Silwood2]|nr:unnamed protein product [Rotaria sp. Silwood2]CAF4564544.1 unnamed protein product [Rotaria sp. Silwood2]
MIIFLLVSLLSPIEIGGKHFNGGTIRWKPIDPYNNSSSVPIAITQSYSWTYPTITCANNVPISTSGRSSANANLTCITDCSTDGGYSTHPVDILTDCVSASSSLGIMSSQPYQGSAWAPLGSPPKSGSYWSISCYIDLRMRADGLINSPPEANIISPQYVIVNTTTQIQIPVSDVNAGDDLRCRWSAYIPGYRRRRQADQGENRRSQSEDEVHENMSAEKSVAQIRKKRGFKCSWCSSTCSYGCCCKSSACAGTLCSNWYCTINPTCPDITTTTETPGTLPTTISYANRQAIDECGGICYPSSVPNGTTLSSNCTLTFTGLIPNTWYAISLQVEDFINTTSTTPMSSVPVQFLIYVMPLPECPTVPIILPASDCYEIIAGVPTTFNLFVLNNCDPNVIGIADVMMSKTITGLQMTNMTVWPTNDSLVFVVFTFTPQFNQIGLQTFCIIAYTE